LLEYGVLCGAINAGLHADVVVVELPIINSILFRLNHEREGLRLPAYTPCDEKVGRVGYWSFVARHPIGAGWVSFIWDDKAFPKPDSTVILGAAPFAQFATASEFAPMEPDMQRQVVVALERAKLLGPQVYAFVPPVFLRGAEAAGFDPIAIRAQLASALAACRTVAGVHCLDLEPFYDRQELFFNLSHFNQRGHQVLAQWLADHIPSPRR